MNEKKKQEIPMDFKLDDFFTSQEQRDDDKKEKVETIDISLIDDFKEHPFKVIENDELKSLEESIQTSGVLSPVIVRPKEDGRYEMISGHRRKFACNKLGIDTIPCLVKNLTDDEATIFMVDSNLQREKLLPSEKAFAYKMKYEALKHQGVKTFLPLDQNNSTSGPLVQKYSAEVLGEEVGESERQVRRYIRLTNLVPELLEMVDNAECGLSPAIAFRPAVELSYLIEDEQRDLVDFIDDEESTPSLAQAIKMQIKLVLKLERILKKYNIKDKYEVLEKDYINKNKKIESDIKLQKDKKRNYYEKWKFNEIAKEYFLEKSQLIENTVKELEKSLLDNKEKYMDILKQTKKDYSWIEKFRRNKNIKVLSKSTIIDLIESIIVYEDENIKINFKYKDEYEELIELLKEEQSHE